MSATAGNVSFYRAYRNYLEEIRNTPSYKAMVESFGHAQEEGDAFSGRIVYRKIDLEWVEAIERALPYIDRAIREQRRFIRQTEEIVPIERSKKVTTESVRHLAQHTSMIGRVEEEKVTPKKLLNIQREESFDIYENRFLRTLIMRAADFVGTCFTTVKNSPGSAVANVKMIRKAFVDRQEMSIGLDCMLEYTEEERKVKVGDDVSGLSEFERILRLRIILSDFLNTPLMTELSQTSTVRNPITRTNLITKDQNFREVLKLWEFLDQYRGTGFSLITDEVPAGSVSPAVKNGIYDALTLLQFVIKLNLSENLKEMFEAEYQAENERRRLEAEAAEIKRTQEALAAQAVLYEKKLNLQKTDYEREILIRQEKYETQMAEEKQTHAQILAELKADSERQLSVQKACFETQLSDQQGKYEGQLSEYQKETARLLEEEKALHEEERNRQIRKFEAEAAEKQICQEKEMEALKEDFRIRSLEMAKASEARMMKQKEEHEAEISAALLLCSENTRIMKNDCDRQISSLTADCEARIQENISGCEARICKLTAEYEKQISELTTGYEKRISALIYEYERRIAGSNGNTGPQTADTHRSFRGSSLNKSLIRVLTGRKEPAQRKGGKDAAVMTAEGNRSS